MISFLCFLFFLFSCTCTSLFCYREAFDVMQVMDQEGYSVFTCTGNFLVYEERYKFG